MLGKLLTVIVCEAAGLVVKQVRKLWSIDIFRLACLLLSLNLLCSQAMQVLGI